MTDCTGCSDCQFDGRDIPSDFHEIHITVQTDDPEKFRRVCEQHQIKPILIAYQTKRDSRALSDVMTSQKFQGTCSEALEETTRIAELLAREGFSIVRKKIETTPTNPVIQNGGGYFEAHLGIKVPHRDTARFNFITACFPELHRSRNAFKVEGSTKTIMLTLRDYETTHDVFRRKVELFQSEFQDAAFDVDRLIIEYCWFDDKVEHDNAWMKA